MIAVLQFDAASGACLDRLISAGRLPALGALLDRGPRIGLDCDATPDFPAATYPTLYSGCELDDHGHYYPFQWVAGEQRLHCADTQPATPPEAVWERLAVAGKRSLVIDPYECLPPRREVGVCMSGWQLAERVVLPRWSRPRMARHRLALRHGRPADVTEVFGAPRTQDLLRLRERLAVAPGRAADATVQLMAGEPFDLVWVNFAAAHLGGHRLWDLSALHETPEKAERDLLESGLDELYEATDAAIDRVVTALPPQCDLLIVSPVGMAANTSRADLLPGMLAAVLGEHPREPGDEPETDAGASGWIWKLRGAAPVRLRTAMAAAVPAPLTRRLTARLELRGMDWNRTAAFAHPADNQGYVRLNLRGRERDGVVGVDEAEGLLERVADGLATFADIDGGPAVAEVARVNRRSSDQSSGSLPDLVVRWSAGATSRLQGVRSPRFGTVARQGGGSGRSGNHDSSSAWAIVVPGTGHRVAEAVDRRLVDIVPTIAVASGVDPAALSGESLITC